ncbi:LysR family transcriptional regulator [Microbacterium sp. zg-YB36]|uniref:LysR family transcriptional regulator n=1 Tax=Microbacterium sp. zg-YB36 TaxID=2969407 RepID=UPI00255986B2|nr:LysR family transcriptional regulator [Microbacterium sp. zg-YB36]MDL5352682.1 LysR family transcriptional regulator [Microbacterium sp. zg-YB36]
MDVDLTRLRYFVAVAEELHFARAAERLRISPSPLSRQIKLLESQFGAELFERNYHEVRLTALGRTLLPHARAMLEAVEAFRSAAAKATDERLEGTEGTVAAPARDAGRYR